MMLIALLLLLVCFAPPTVHSLTTSSMTNKPILCVGIASLDTIATLEEFPSPDAKLRSTCLTHAGGGNAANTAVAISRLSKSDNKRRENGLFISSVDLVTAVGSSNGNIIIDGLREESVGVHLIEQYTGESPWSYIMVVDDTRTIIHQPATRDLSLEHVHGIDLEQYGAVHFDVRHPKAAMYIAQQCVQLGIPYSVDVERPREGLLPLLQHASIVICNSNYCNLVLGDDKDKNTGCDDDDIDRVNIVRRLRSVFAEQAPKSKICMMTLGNKGSCLILPQEKEEAILGKEGSVVIPSSRSEISNSDDDSTKTVTPQVIVNHGALWCESFPNCNVVDTTGAGDAFQGGFLSTIWGYAYKKSTKGAGDGDHNGRQRPLQVPVDKTVLGHALRMATRVAAAKITMTGAREGLPTSDDPFIASELNQMLEEII